jgi:hypothetical protein
LLAAFDQLSPAAKQTIMSAHGLTPNPADATRPAPLIPPPNPMQGTAPRLQAHKQHAAAEPTGNYPAHLRHAYGAFAAMRLREVTIRYDRRRPRASGRPARKATTAGKRIWEHYTLSVQATASNSGKILGGVGQWLATLHGQANSQAALTAGLCLSLAIPYVRRTAASAWTLADSTPRRVPLNGRPVERRGFDIPTEPASETAPETTEVVLHHCTPG